METFHADGEFPNDLSVSASLGFLKTSEPKESGLASGNASCFQISIATSNTCFSVEILNIIPDETVGSKTVRISADIVPFPQPPENVILLSDATKISVSCRKRRAHHVIRAVRCILEAQVVIFH